MPQDAERTLSESEIYEILSNERRQLALKVLREEGGEMDLRDLAEAVAEAESQGRSARQKNVQSVYVTLYQTHLPKLDELDIVEYEGKTVRLTDRAEEVDVGFGSIAGSGNAWSELYLGLSLSGLFTMAWASAGLPILDAVSSTAWGIIHIALVGGIAAYQTIQWRGSIPERVRPW